MDLFPKRIPLLAATLLAFQMAACTAWAAQTSTTVDPNLAGGLNGHGTKLGAKDSVVIEAPHMSLPIVGTNGCLSIINKSDVSYFVPWNTQPEWDDFLLAIEAPRQLNSQTLLPNNLPNVFVGTCCQPQIIGNICSLPDGTVISSNLPLGYRYKGTPSQDIAEWGAEGDVQGPIFASNIGDNPDLTYRVTYVCSSGTWVKTHEEGSCVPVSGQCAPGIDGLTVLPSDYATLCSATSIFGGFTNAGGAAGGPPWGWLCLGTPGQSDASCSTGPLAGDCGSAAGQLTWQAPTQNLCTNGKASAVTGPDQNPFNPANNPATTYVPNLYHWTCTGTGNGATTTSCTAPTGGDCNGNIVGHNNLTVAPNPATDYLCNQGKPDTVFHTDTGQTNLWGTTEAGWNWHCLSYSGDGITKDYWTAWCVAFDAGAVSCGSANGVVDNSSTNSPTGQLCANSTLISGPTYDPGPPAQWVWQCQGGSTTVDCGSEPVAACGTANKVSYPSSSPPSTLAELCAAGTPNPNPPHLDIGAGQWEWGCDGSGGIVELCIAPSIITGQCGSSNGVPTTTPPSNLCAPGNTYTAPVVVGGNWQWSCTGTGSGGGTANCSAPNTAASGTPTCGAAAGSPSTTVPNAGLCGPGNAASTPVDNGSNQWVWTCQGDGGAYVSCSAPDSGAGAGLCGTANGTAVPDIPNFNLCSQGVPSTVTGTGPWNWTCLGNGAYTGQDSSCHADICQACSGTVTSNQTSTSITGTVNGCAVQGYSSWSQTNLISPTGVSKLLQWSDPLHGTFSQSILTAATATGNYCRPCYLSAQSVSNAAVVVQATAGSCPGDTNLNTGNPVTYSATGVTLTSQ